jgi:hypothetical protein
MCWTQRNYGEASALRDGLLLAQQIGTNQVQNQDDCMEVVDTTSGRRAPSRARRCGH